MLERIDVLTERMTAPPALAAPADVASNRWIAIPLWLIAGMLIFSLIK